jgi:uncharacterized membrane protein YkoI
MDTRKLAVGAALVTVLALGGGAAIAAQGEDPEVKGSVAAPEGSGREDDPAATQGFDKLAKTERSAAEDAALNAVPGEVQEIELENEGGSVVYEVEVAGDDGKLHEVVVDAGTGEVLDQEIETEDEDSEADD